MPLSINDTDLIISLQKGEGAAFEAIYMHYVRPLRFYVGRFVKDNAAAEDIAVEVFTRTFKKHADFSSIDKLRSYLYTTANRAAIDYYRLQKKENILLGHVAGMQDQSMEDAELAYIRTEAIKAIHDAIENLPPQQQQIIRMLFLEGKKLPEIAAELNLSYNTVQNHRQRGLELLRIQLINNKVLSGYGLWLALALLT